MKTAIFFILFVITFSVFAQKTDFKKEQLANSRVKKAYEEKGEIVKKLLSDNQIDIKTMKLFVRVFKKEDLFEVWAKDKNHSKYVLLKSYTICSKSGELGPKRREGDLQVPEGFYAIEAYNPNGTYYLTMWVNYPNASDRILSNQQHPGGDICIHGKCVTIGCMPMTDDKIQEIYLLCIEAYSNGQKSIPTHIFPGKLDAENYKNLLVEYSENKELIRFWANLKSGFDFFQKNKTLPSISVDAAGKYWFAK